MQDSLLWKRIAINVPASEVIRPPQAEWESLEAGNKWAHGFVVLPGSEGVTQMQTPCITCPNCRSLNFKEIHKCTNKYRGKTAFSKFQSKKRKESTKEGLPSATD